MTGLCPGSPRCHFHLHKRRCNSSKELSYWVVGTRVKGHMGTEVPPRVRSEQNPSTARSESKEVSLRGGSRDKPSQEAEDQAESRVEAQAKGNSKAV